MENGNCLIKLAEHIRNNMKIIDLSYDMEEKMPVWPTHPRYSSVVYESYEYGDAAMQSMITFGEHTGTHIDAPKHFIPDGKAVDELNLNQLMGRAVLIDATHLKAKETLSLDDIKKVEATYGEIKEGDWILIHFGWDKKYALQPGSKDFLSDWPGLGKSAAQYFVDKKVSAVGSDTLSLDTYGALEYVSHEILLGNNIPIIENIRHLEQLPVHSYVVGLPNKFKGGSGSPIRLIAFVEENFEKKVKQ